MGSLQIDLDLVQRINRRMKIRTAGTVSVLATLIAEVSFIIYILLFGTFSIDVNFIPLSLLIFSAIPLFLIYYVVFQFIDLQEARESKFDGIKKNYFIRIKKRSRNFLMIFLVFLTISIILIVLSNQGNAVVKTLHQGDVAYFPSSYNFGTKAVKNIVLEGYGNVLLYQNGSAVPTNNIVVNGNIILTQSFPPGYYEIAVQSGNINVHIYTESVYTTTFLPLLSAIVGLLLILYVNIIASKKIGISVTNKSK